MGTSRRSVLVRVNPKELQKLNAYYTEINKQVEGLLSETPKAELELVVKFLARMNAVRPERRAE